MNKITSAAAGLAMAFTAAVTGGANAQSIEFNFGNGSFRLHLDTDRHRYERDYPRYLNQDRRRYRERDWQQERYYYDRGTGGYYTHPSQLNNCRWTHVPRGGSHGGTYSYCR